MRHLSWVLGVTLFLLAFGFAIKNSETVTLYYYLGYQWQAPLVVIVLTVFFVGVITGIAASLGFVFRQRREIQKLRRELRSRPQPGTGENNKKIITQRPDDGI